MVAAWRGGDRKGAAALAPEELLREIFVFGRPEEMRERLGAFAAAGITTLCLMPICEPRAPARADRRAGAGMSDGLVIGDDGQPRCPWGVSTPDYARYHDEEWGRPVHGADALYERLCLEAFQSGLSWLTILRKREAFRAAFAGFAIAAVARFGPDDVERLMGDAGIVRNRAKIDAAIANARAADGDRRPRRADLVVRARPGGAARRRARAPTSRRSRRSPPRWPRRSSARGSGSSGRPPRTR